MSPRLRGRHRRADLPGMLEALDLALERLDGRADTRPMARARAIAARAGERLRLSGEHTVVALAGSTGSGKSSLFNTLVGEEASPVGVRRPTTSKAHACVWGDGQSAGAAPLVQWLGVPRKHTTWRHGSYDAWGRDRGRSAPDDALAGLVLLDLPDHDSTVVEHRQEVDRLVELVDLLVWVVDPQKYADQALHERYLRRLANHASVVLVVMNKVDTVNPFAAAECSQDLRRLLDEDGLRRARLLACSARTGAGIEALSDALAEAVRARQARNDRLVADIENVVDSLAAYISGEDPPGVTREDRDQLVESLASAAGVPAIASAVEQSWRLRSHQNLGWPVTRWLQRLRPDPLRRLHLRGRDRKEVGELLRSSVPEPTPVQRARVDNALRQVCDSAAAGLPEGWQRSVRAAAHGRSGDVQDALDQAVVGTDLGVDRVPLWWRAVGAAQWALFAAAVVGLGWLTLLGVGGYLRLPELPTPQLGPLPVPTLLLVGGLLAGWLLAMVSRAMASGGAVARRLRAQARLRRAIEQVADELMLAPVAEELERHREARDALERAGTGAR